MKRIHLPTIWLSIALGCLSARLEAQNFDNGSSGALGDVVIEQDTTIDLPPDGVLNYASLRVASGKTLRFKRNSMNTPVYLLSRGDVTIEGIVDVSGSGAPNDAPTGGAAGPGGFDGGKPGFVDFAPGAGYGPGGGLGGASDANNPSGAGGGSYGGVGPFNNTNKGAIYGSAFLIPLVGGSGGGGTIGSPGRGGGGGGGAIIISSNSRIRHTGRILAVGGGPNNGGNGGSGGAIRLLAPVLSGTGELNVFAVNNWAGRGRIRLDTIDRTDVRFNFQPAEAVSAGANMFIFPQPVPRLDVVQVGARDIPVGSGPTQVQLPFGSSPNVPITVEASNWRRKVPIRVVLTPDSGLPVKFDAEIDNSANTPARVTVPAVFPVNTLVNVQVWTR